MTPPPPPQQKDRSRVSARSQYSTATTITTLAVIALIAALASPAQCNGFLSERVVLTAAGNAVPCPKLDEPYILTQNGLGLTDRQVLEIMTAVVQCPLWSSVRNATISFQQNGLTTTAPFQQALHKLDKIVELNLLLSANQLINPGVFGFNKLFEAMRDLKYVKIDLSLNQLDEIRFLEQTFLFNEQLESVTLSLGGNLIENLEGLGTVLLGNKRVKKVNLYLYNSRRLKNAAALERTFESLTEVEEIVLLVQLSALTNLDVFEGVFRNQGKLRSLVLDLQTNKQIENLNGLQKAFRETRDLRQLNLQFAGCEKLSNASALAEAFENLIELTSLQISFSSLQKSGAAVANIDWMAHAFKNLKSLRDLDVQMSGNGVESIGALSTAFHSLTRMQSLRLDFYYNKIKDLAPIANAFRNTAMLSSFYVQLERNAIVKGVTELSYALINDIAPRGAFCPFYLNLKQNPIVTDDQLAFDALRATRNTIYPFYQATICAKQDFKFLL